MATTATINTGQRKGLLELLRNHLSGIGDVWLALEVEGDFEKAERLAREFAADFRLLDDLGWDPDRRGEPFELTMPEDELIELLNRLHDEAWHLFDGSPSERQARYEDQEIEEHLKWGLYACGELLHELKTRER